MSHSANKFGKFPERVIALRQGGHPPPAQVLLSIADLCNHDCPWCSFRRGDLPTSELFAVDGNRNPPRFLPEHVAIGLLDELAAMRVGAVQLTGGGEPTVHPRFSNIASAVLVRGMELGLVTNGARLPERWEVPVSVATWVRVSIDAAKRETYAALRRVSSCQFDYAWQNVGKMVALRGPTVGVSFVVQRENYREIEEFASMARNVGAAYARFTALTHPDGERYFDTFGQEAEHMLSMAAYLQHNGFQVINQFRERRHCMVAPEQKECWYQHFAPFVGADWGVYRCCNTAYTSAGLLGSLKEKSFREVWSAAAMRTFDARSCSHCIFKDKNAEIARLVAAPVGHEAFP